MYLCIKAQNKSLMSADFFMFALLYGGNIYYESHILQKKPKYICKQKSQLKVLVPMPTLKNQLIIGLYFGPWYVY